MRVIQQNLIVPNGLCRLCLRLFLHLEDLLRGLRHLFWLEWRFKFTFCCLAPIKVFEPHMRLQFYAIIEAKSGFRPSRNAFIDEIGGFQGPRLRCVDLL